MMPASPLWRLEHVQDLPLEIRARQDAVDEVRPIEGADELRPDRAGRAASTMSLRTRSVAVAVNACMLTPGSIWPQLGELPILRPEIVSPLADAVRLVDGDEARRA